MAADREAEKSPGREFACPNCEELFSAPKEQLVVVCPACGQTFPVPEPE
jgi:DNA-directed RNA polymerase subunit RPC12/RpoP